VRNSILLVDFVNLQLERGVPLAQAIIDAAAARAKPIALTGLAAMAGALFILDDPISTGSPSPSCSASRSRRCSRWS